MRIQYLRNVIVTVIVGTILALAAAPASMAEDAAAAAAQLSVTLTSSKKTVTAGDNVTYTGKVKNLGASDTKVTIDVDAPAYVDLGKSTGATVDKNGATWSTTIAPGKTQTIVIDATIGKIPGSERRVTTLASVYVGDAKAPVVRTANASFITGVDDTPGVKSTSAAASSSSATMSALFWVIGSGIALLLAIAAVIFVLVRRNRRRPRRSGVHDAG